MRTRRIFYLVSFLILMLLFSACSTSRKGRKSSKRYNRERCDCPRFSEMVSTKMTYMLIGLCIMEARTVLCKYLPASLC
jgi:hypothetical protein